jgi:hypothetical protein
MYRRRFFGLICAATAALAVFSESNRAEADQILAFGQTSGVNTIVGANNGADTTTTITATNVAVSITQIAGGSPVLAILNLTASNVGAASMVGGFVTQDFSGNFQITSGAGGTGTNYLSGVFTDAVFGANTGLTLTASAPASGQSLVLTSSVIGTLLDPEAISFSFANVTPSVNITGTTLGAFTSSISGTASATVTPEPGTIAMALTALPLLGLGAYARRRRARA